MLHMLDTDTVSYLIKGKSPAIETKLAALVPSMVCISVMTRAELLYGLKRLPADHRLHLAVRQFLKIDGRTQRLDYFRFSRTCQA